MIYNHRARVDATPKYVIVSISEDGIERVAARTPMAGDVATSLPVCLAIVKLVALNA